MRIEGIPPVVDNFPRVEEIFWIKGRLDLAHRREEFRAQVRLEKFCAGDAHAVLT